MAHDVFISHSNRDITAANAICAWLEARGIRCWMAQRDLLPGTQRAEAIVQALAQSRVMVLVLSEGANHSSDVISEAERAVSHGVAILPFRIDGVPPAPALELMITGVHWLDAMTPPLERHLGRLTDAVNSLLVVIDQPGPPDAGLGIGLSPGVSKRFAARLPVIVGSALLLIALVIIGAFVLSPGHDASPGSAQDKGTDISGGATKGTERQTSASSTPPAKDYSQPVYADDFSDPARTLFLAFQQSTSNPSEVLEKRLIDGELVADVNTWKANGVRTMAGPTFSGLANYAVEFDQRSSGRTTALSFGLTFDGLKNSTDVRATLLVRLTQDNGRLVVYTAEGNIAAQPLLQTVARSIKSENNHLRFEIRGEELRTFVNGSLIDKVSHPFLAGRPATLQLTLWSTADVVPADAARLYFDNFKVFELP